MNYKKVYDALVLKAKEEQRKKGLGVYYERHHILPRCMGGGNTKSNIVLFTGREHYIAHILLCKIYPHNYKLLYAAHAMCTFGIKSPKYGRNYNPNSRIYQSLREELYKYQKSKKLSEEQKQYLREYFSGSGNPMYGKKRPKYIGEAVAKANRERVWSTEARKKTGARGEKNIWYGKKIPERMKVLRRLKLCYDMLLKYDTNIIDESTWDEHLLYRSGLGYKNVLKYFGKFSIMIDMVNKQYNTNYKVKRYE